MARITDLHKKWLKEPKYKKAYDALEEEFVLASAVMEVRNRAGLTQEELARKMGTTQPVVARLESGRWSVWRKLPDRACSSASSLAMQSGLRGEDGKKGKGRRAAGAEAVPRRSWLLLFLSFSGCDAAILRDVPL